MNIKDGLWIGGIAFLALMIGCQTSPPQQDTVATKDDKKQEQQVPADKNQEQQTEQKSQQEQTEKGKDALDTLTKKDVLEQQQNANYVDHLIKTAQTKLADNDYQSAKNFIEQALKIDPTNAEAIRLSNLIGGILGERLPQGETREKMYEHEVQVKIEQAKLEAQNHYKEGLDALHNNNYDRAIREFERAVEIIKLAPYQLGLDSLHRQAETQIKKVQDLKEKWLAEQREKKMVEAQKMAEKLETEEQARRTSQIRLLLSKATDYYTKKQYDNAQSILDQIFKIDSANKIAKKLQNDIREAYHSNTSERTLVRKIEGWKRFLEDIKETSIPYSQLLSYPEREYWENVIKKRETRGLLGQTTREKEEQVTDAVNKIKNELESKKVNWDFTDYPFQEVITVIRFQDKINVVVDQKVIQDFELEGIKVSLQLKNVILKDALNILLDLYNLTYIFKNDVLFITSKDSDLAKKKVFPVLHDIRDLTGQIKDFPGPRIELAKAQGDQPGSGALFKEDEAKGEPPITGEKLVDLIKTSIAPKTWESEKGQYSIAVTSGQLLVVHEEKIHEEISQFLNDLRSFAGTMVAIESRFLEVTDDFLEHLGVDWRGIGDSALDPTATRTRPVLPAVTAGTEDEASDTWDNTQGSFSPSSGLFFNESSSTGNSRELKHRRDVRIRTEHIDDGTLGTRLKATGGMALQIATLDDLGLSAVLWMVKKTGRGEILTAPRLTAFNTERANITVVEQRAYVRDFDVEVAQSAYIADPVIGTIQTGVVLDVRPIISNDRKYLTLELRPTIASLTRVRPFTTELGGRGRNVTFEVPEIRLQSIESTVRIPDQGTLMIGGLKSFREIDRKLDIPVLGNIPVISFFFSQRTKVDEKQNLLILVTGKIIDVEEEERKTFGTPAE